MENQKKYYITTPIYYPSDNLHIGHAYCSVAADTAARFKKLEGYDTYFLTGTDEHGQKIERKAAAKGVTPQAYVDEIVAGIKDLWKLMDVDYNDFIRTSDERHVKAVQKIFRQLYEQGDIYKGSYEGWYCTPCESFFTELQLKDGNQKRACVTTAEQLFGAAAEPDRERRDFRCFDLSRQRGRAPGREGRRPTGQRSLRHQRPRVLNSAIRATTPSSNDGFSMKLTVSTSIVITSPW